MLTAFRNTLCMLKNLNDGVIYKLRSEQVCQNNEGTPQENSSVQLNRQSPNIARGKNRHKLGQQNIVCSNREHLSSPREMYGGIKLETRSSWLNCALRDDEAVYWVSIGHYEAVAVGN